jgi:hypothetical protein
MMGKEREDKISGISLGRGDIIISNFAVFVWAFAGRRRVTRGRSGAVRADI